MRNSGSFQKRTPTHTQRKFLLSRKGAGEVSGEERGALLIFSVWGEIFWNISSGEGNISSGEGNIFSVDGYFMGVYVFS